MLMVIPGAWAFESGRWAACGSQSIGLPAGGVDGMGLIGGLKAIRGIAALALAFGFVDASRAETIETALVQAYQNNPQLNAQRASVRATDENVPQALSGYRPRVSATIQVGEQYTDVTTRQFANGQPIYNQQSGTMTPQTYSLNSSYTAFNGFQTGNRTRQAESQVFAARETLRVT